MYSVLIAAGAAMGLSMLGRYMPATWTLWGKVMVPQKAFSWPRVALMMAGALLSAMLLAPLLVIANRFYGNSLLVDSILTAFWLWLGFAGMTLYMRHGFDQWPTWPEVAAIGYELLILEVIAILLAWPAL